MNISSETHIFRVDNVVIDNVIYYKLPYTIWGCNYLVFWNNGTYSCYYDSEYNQFVYLCGDLTTAYSITEKPKDKPWTAEDAVKHLDKELYGSNGTYLFSIGKISSTHVFAQSSEMKISYEDMLKYHCTVGWNDPTKIPAYNKA